MVSNGEKEADPGSWLGFRTSERPVLHTRRHVLTLLKLKGSTHSELEGYLDIQFQMVNDIQNMEQLVEHGQLTDQSDGWLGHPS